MGPMTVTGCNAAATFNGDAACSSGSLPITETLAKVAPFVGAFLIISGLVMLFWGSKFIFMVFGFLMGLFGTGVMFALLYSTIVKNDSSTGKFVGVLIVSSILGAAFSYFTYKFSKAWAVALIAAFGGFVVAAICIGVLGTSKHAVQIIILVAGCALGLFVGKKFNAFVRAVGTSLIGAFMTVRGIGCYAPGYPSELGVINQAKTGDLEFQNEIYFYFFGFVALAIVGSVVQWIMHKETEAAKDDDFMEAEDEGKACSCLRI